MKSRIFLVCFIMTALLLCFPPRSSGRGSAFMGFQSILKHDYMIDHVYLFACLFGVWGLTLLALKILPDPKK